MEAMGYQVVKGRGISFIDSKMVRTKGSEIDLSLSTINKILDLQSEIKMESVKQKNGSLRQAKISATEKRSAPLFPQKTEHTSILGTLVHDLSLLFFDVMKSEAAYYGESYPNLYPPKKKRKKRKQHHI